MTPKRPTPNAPNRAMRRAAARAARQGRPFAPMWRTVPRSTVGRRRAFGYAAACLGLVVAFVVVLAVALVPAGLVVSAHPAGANLPGLQGLADPDQVGRSVTTVVVLGLAVAGLGAILLPVLSVLGGLVGLSAVAAGRAWRRRYDREQLTFTAPGALRFGGHGLGLWLVPSRRTGRTDGWVRLVRAGSGAGGVGGWPRRPARAGAVVGVSGFAAATTLAWPAPPVVGGVLVVTGIGAVTYSLREMSRATAETTVDELYLAPGWSLPQTSAPAAGPDPSAARTTAPPAGKRRGRAQPRRGTPSRGPAQDPFSRRGGRGRGAPGR